MLPLTDSHCKCVTQNKSYDRSTGRKTKWTFFCFSTADLAYLKRVGGMGAERMFSKTYQDTTFRTKRQKQQKQTETETENKTTNLL